MEFEFDPSNLFQPEQKPAGRIVPFGKYRGQPLEVLANDRQYVDWLMQQPWFNQQHPQLVQVIVNNFGTPQDTPEHNQMQAKFLDDEWRWKCAAAVSPKTWNVDAKSILDGMLHRIQSRISDCSRVFGWAPPMPLRIDFWFVRHMASPNFEADGIDVVFGIRYGIEVDYDSRCYDSKIEKTFRIELKPIVSDDYPSFLRQMKRHGSNVLIYREYTGRGVTEEIFRKLFESQGIRVVSEADVLAAPVPKLPEITLESLVSYLAANGIQVVANGNP